jgi:hypothetical protein
LQNQINSYLANPNVDESAKSSARKQLEELSTIANTYGSRKEARKFAISTLNSIASSLKTSEDYTPEYVTPSSGLPYIETFNPEMASNRYNVAGVKPDLNKTVQEFSDFLAQQLTHAQGILSDNGKVLYGWNKANTDQINTWLTKLAEQPATEQAAKEKISYMGNVIVNALANEGLARAFENKFAPWLEGSDEYAAAQATAAAEAQKAAKNPADLAAYPTLTSKGYIFEKGSDGKYTAYQVNTDGTKGDAVNQEAGYMNPDFTSSGYKSGWIIGPNGVVTLINDFSDVTTYRDYLRTEGWKEAIKNAKRALEDKYPSIFNFTNTFDQNPFGEGIAHGNKNFVDLSYYFPGEGYVLGVQKDTDADNFEGYNWNEEDREFYVSKDGQNWEIVKGMAAVRTLLGLDEGNGFNYEGADILADPDIDNRSQFNRNEYLNKPEDWDRIHTATPRKNWWEDYGFDDEASFIRDLVKLTLPGNYEKALAEFSIEPSGIKKASELKEFVDNNVATYKEKGFYKWLFLKAQSIGLSKDLLAGILMRYNFGKKMPLTIKEEEAKAMVAGAKGEVGEDPVESHAKGGILKFENGGSWYLEYANVRPDKAQSSSIPVKEDSESFAMTELTNRADASGRSIAGQAKGEGNFKLDGPMVLRMAAFAADVAGLVASFMPGGGTVAAGVTGAASFVLDSAADLSDESVSGTDKALNAASNLFFGVLGMIPGGKVWKVTKTLGALGGSLYSLGIITPDIYKKVKAGESLTYDDWKSVYAGLSILVNSSTMARSTYNLHKMKKLGA